MTSMAAALAASLPAVVAPQQKTAEKANANAAAVVPQRMEGLIDPEGLKPVESVALSSLVLLKVLKHSTDPLPAAPQSNVQQDRNPPPQTALSSRPDAVGVLLGLDLDGVLEVEDCFALPAGETGLGPKSYASQLFPFLRDVQTPDSPVGVYLSTRNGGFLNRSVLELVLALEAAVGRGKAVLVVHDATKALEANDLSVRAYVLSDGARKVAKGGKWDGASLTESRLTPSNMLTPLPTSITSPALISAFLSTLPPSASSSSPAATSSASSSASSPLTPASSAALNASAPLPTQFTPLLSTATSLSSYLNDTLDSLTLSHAEGNNVAFLQRQTARERAKHEGQAREREEENVRRKAQGLGELPPLAKFKEGNDPNRLELLCLQGQLDGLARGLASEAGKGLVQCYL